MQSTSICCQCKIEFPCKLGSIRKFCTKSCSATYNNTGRIRSTESKQKISQIIQNLFATGDIKTKTLSGQAHPRWKGGKQARRNSHCSTCQTPLQKCQKKFCSDCATLHKPQRTRHTTKTPHKCLMCDTLISNKNKTCSDACKIERYRQASSENLRKNRHKYVGPHQRSWMERSFVEWLESHGIHQGIYGYKDQVHFKYKLNNKTKNGWADFVFVSRKLIIELDGTHHKTRVDLDALRDYHLSSKRGYQVVRISHADYIKGTRIAEIKNLLSI